MATLLRIYTSPRINGSHSRELGDHFERYWLDKHPNDRVVRRDLGINPPPVPLDDLIKAHIVAEKRPLTDEEKRVIALSDELTEEYLHSDTLLLTAPMYNFSPPASFKTWLDHIVRRGHFFGFDAKTGNLVGLLDKRKRIFVVAAYGLPFRGQPWEDADYMFGVITKVFEFCGIPRDNLHMVSAEGTAIADLKNPCKQKAKREIEELIERVS